jgi:predicted DNA-binding transcriptional regulator AlpA
MDLDPILRRPKVLQTTGFSGSTLDRLIKLPPEQDPFPKPIRLGLRMCGWRLSEVKAWLERRKSEPLRGRTHIPTPNRRSADTTAAGK